MARQQASGLLGYSALISASFDPVSSKSKRAPRFCQNGATLSMILIFFPLAVRSIDNLEREGGVSNEMNQIAQCSYHFCYACNANNAQ